MHSLMCISVLNKSKKLIPSRPKRSSSSNSPATAGTRPDFQLYEKVLFLLWGPLNFLTDTGLRPYARSPGIRLIMMHKILHEVCQQGIRNVRRRIKTKYILNTFLVWFFGVFFSFISSHLARHMFKLAQPGLQLIMLKCWE